MKCGRFHVKFGGFHEIRNERRIARNGKAYVSLMFIIILVLSGENLVLSELLPTPKENCGNTDE